MTALLASLIAQQKRCREHRGEGGTWCAPYRKCQRCARAGAYDAAETPDAAA